jgi:hypothetical protein
VRGIWLTLLIVAAVPTAVTGSSAIESSEAAIAGIGLGASEEAVRKAFGEPRREEVSSQPASGRAKELRFRGARAYFFDDRLYRLSCTFPRYRTPAGLRVGVMGFEVMARHGEPSTDSHGRYRWLGYKVVGSNGWLGFRLNEDGRVDEVLLRLLKDE